MKAKPESIQKEYCYIFESCLSLLHFSKTQILKSKRQLTYAFFAAINHLSRTLRKQKFTPTGSKGHGLWFVIGGFWSILCISAFQGSLLVIVIMIQSSCVFEKRSKTLQDDSTFSCHKTFTLHGEQSLLLSLGTLSKSLWQPLLRPWWMRSPGESMSLQPTKFQLSASGTQTVTKGFLAHLLSLLVKRREDVILLENQKRQIFSP